MVAAIPVYEKGDPKVGAMTVPFHTPHYWPETSESFAQTATMIGGVSMVSKSAVMAFMTLSLGILSLFNQRPLSQKIGKDGVKTNSSPWAAIGMGVAAVIATYIPRMTVPPVLRAAQSAADAVSATISGAAGAAASAVPI